MNLKRTIIAAVVFCVFFGFAFSAVIEDTPGMMRVLLLETPSVKIISLSGCFSVVKPDGHTDEFLEETEFKAEGDFISFKDNKASGILKLSSPSYMQVNGKPYRGDIFILSEKPGYLLVINKLKTDEYLYGVVGGEMPASWHIEALKAQSVAARTYAASMKRTPRHASFDVFSTVKDQIYAGVEGESPSVIEAVNATSGEILVFNDSPISAFFHSNCAGRTSPGDNVFESGDLPYLASASCPYCAPSEWTYSIKRDELSKLLNDKKIISGDLLDIKIDKTDDSGRAVSLKIIASNGVTTVKAADFRLALGADKQKSTKYSLVSTPMDGAEKKVFLLSVKICLPSNDSDNETSTLVDEKVVQADTMLQAQMEKESLEHLAGILAASRLPVSIASIKSEISEIDVSSAFTFSGSGWGHGVGMCQWGAYGFAKNGWDYRKILYNYYPGTNLTKASF